MLEIELILLILAFIVTIVAVISDIKTTEVPDYANYFLIFSAVSLRVLYSLITKDWSFSLAILDSFPIIFILALAIGFGIQVSLFTYVRSYKNALAATSVSVSGGVSTTSMAACCAHHISDILPIIGFSAAAIFLVKYQLTLILIGLFSNLIGINFMLHTMKKHNLFDNNHKLFSKIMKQDLKFILKLNIILSFIIILVSINYTGGII